MATLNITVAARDSSGMSGTGAATIDVTTSSSFPDGSSAAPTGTAQLPNLLSSYVAKPTWKVAGVDYRVGINAGVALKNGMTAAVPAGCSRSGTNFFVQSANVVLDGWDFSGMTCDVNAADVTIKNCKFNPKGFIKFEPSAAHRGTVRYCEFDTQGQSFPIGFLVYFADGLITVEYCHFKRAWPMACQFTNGNGSNMAIVFRYNLIENCGLGAVVDGSHGDFVQIFGGNFYISSMDMSYNTVAQTMSAAQAATQGWSIQGSANVTEIRNGKLNNNTTVIVPGANVNYGVLLDTSFINTNFDLKTNYWALGPAQFITSVNSSPDGPFNGTITKTGNINMVTGGLL